MGHNLTTDPTEDKFRRIWKPIINRNQFHQEFQSQLKTELFHHASIDFKSVTMRRSVYLSRSVYIRRLKSNSTFATCRTASACAISRSKIGYRFGPQSNCPTKSIYG